MAGLFGFGGGGGGTVTYAPEPTQAQQAASDANKGATDIEKLKEKKQREMSYGNATRFATDTKLSSDDTTLASGSLLSLGSKLG